VNWRILLRALLPGLLPVLVFIAAEAMFGEVVGLIVGVGVGLGEFIVTLVRNRRADPFVAADTVLLAIAGGLSLLLHNELFFKLKPVVVEAVMGGGLALLLALPPSALKGYMASQLRGVEIPEALLPNMRRNVALLLMVLALHCGLTVWAALTTSTAVWGFISGGLLYLLFGAVVLVQLAVQWNARRRRAAPRGREEMLAHIDEEGRVLDVLPRSAFHRGPGTLHPALHLHITDGTGRLYLQKRPASSDLDPGLWGAPVAMHAPAHEPMDVTLARALGKRLGVSVPPPGTPQGTPQPFLRYKWEDERESELVFCFLMQYLGVITPDPRVIAEGRFWTRAEINENLGTGLFAPRFEFEVRLMERMIPRPS